MRILFWGTPDFAVPPLRALLGEGHDVVGVVTQPDKPRGRSRSSTDASPVKEVAMAEGLPILQPNSPRGDDFVAQVAALEPDISVVVAYGRILPREVIELPPLGTINIHASVLPALRGAAPIQRAILEGFTETGVSIMQMVPALDAGPVIHVLRTPIPPNATYGDLHGRLSELGALGIVQALAMIEAEVAVSVEQDAENATYASKIERSTTLIDFNRPASQVERVIQAFDPRPGAVATLNGKEVKLFCASATGEGEGDVESDELGAQIDDATLASKPGTVRTVDEHGLLIRCSIGALRVGEVQPSGKTRISAMDWYRGRGIAVGDVFDPVVNSD